MTVFQHNHNNIQYDISYTTAWYKNQDRYFRQFKTIPNNINVKTKDTVYYCSYYILFI